MWKLVYGSSRGTSHERLGAPCQDNCLGSFVSIGCEEILILACADGAGTAEFSSEGSRAACEGMIRLASTALQNGRVIESLNRDDLCSWYSALRHQIEREARSRGSDAREFACTLLTAVIGERHAVFAQIGDGAIVILDGDSYTAVFWPQTGEYASTTNFLTDQHVTEMMDFAVVEANVNELAMFTDGLQMLTLNFADRAVHAPFFVPMFKSLRSVSLAKELFMPLHQFLSSPEVNDRTDDDKTLLLATRLPQDDSQPPGP